MKKFIIGFILGSLIFGGTTYAYRVQRPFRITDFDQKNLVILNETLENLWDVTNGRLSLNIVTTNPDGILKGNGGDVVIFNNSGTYYLCVNTTGSTIWRATVLTDTP